MFGSRIRNGHWIDYVNVDSLTMLKPRNRNSRTDSCVSANPHCADMRTRPCRHCQTLPVRSRGLLSGLATTMSKHFVAITSMLGSQFIRFMNGTLPSEITVPRQIFNRSMLQRERSSTRNTFEHFRVRREFFHEHQKTLNGFLRFVTGETAANEIDLFQFPRLQQEFFAARSGPKDVNGRINSLIANFSVQDHFLVARSFELLKDQLVHTAAGFDQGCGDN